jgi:hypothetical protein
MSRSVTLVPGVRNPDKATPRSVYGVLLHTTGGGVTAMAKKRKERPIDVALRIYIDSQNGSNGYKWGGPTYVLDHDGDIWQLAPETILTNHCGGPHRLDYRSDAWLKMANKVTIAQWFKNWAPKYRNPYDLFPSRNPNIDYCGIEMIPIGDGFGNKPMAAGLRFSEAQHVAAATLAADIAARYKFPAGWAHSARLVGHEDVDPLKRSDAGGGWDPGYSRAKPYFDFAYVRSCAAQLYMGVMP